MLWHSHLTYHSEPQLLTLLCCLSRQELESPSVVRHMPVKPGQGSAALGGANTICTSYPFFFFSPFRYISRAKTSNVWCLRASAASCHPHRPLGDGQPCERSRRPPSACLGANLAWTSFPLGSGRTPGEEPVGCGCSAELDEEACDLWNTCSRIRWATSTQGDHIIMWSIKVWFTLPWFLCP